MRGVTTAFHVYVRQGKNVGEENDLITRRVVGGPLTLGMGRRAAAVSSSARSAALRLEAGRWRPAGGETSTPALLQNEVPPSVAEPATAPAQAPTTSADAAPLQGRASRTSLILMWLAFASACAALAMAAFVWLRPPAPAPYRSPSPALPLAPAATPLADKSPPAPPTGVQIQPPSQGVPR